ncbi:MAG: endonuclease/exonuclease/phosphatase family protein [Planctomycetes bacterium]|nr:endonuclease/exonuclease/phosphatase family protein [Planctomycetota bacterium]
MRANPLIRRRIVLGQEVREPTLLAMVLTVAAYALLLGVCVVAIAGLPAFGFIWWTFAAVAVFLVWLTLGLQRKAQPLPTSLTSRQRWFRRIRGWARLLFIGVLGCWLGLILWLAFCPGGPVPPPKADPAFIRVVTWNIHCGQDEGLPWKRFDWPARKHALRAALDEVQPDILCVQEATPEQVAFLEETLPGHHRVGIGRDGINPNGESVGEHCAIYFNRQRFEQIDGNTFWLEEPIDQPRAGSALDVKRICTWVRLRDNVVGRTLRVYNTHLYLTESPRMTAAKLILAHMTAGDRADAILLTADFNASPSVPSRRLFLEAGLADSAERAGKPTGKPTFQLYGIGLWCIDGILVDSKWGVNDHRVLDVKPKNIFPSDHFALLADLVLPEKSP